ncbi:16560_t:CDS:2 [Funneliformis mosseae]|uniref:16560_t:CDS:1 n=1 Tax=Funneliformis mosseae TaxID=27381 RepID=A0A9N9B7C0_FUNMO|nr:16560_t:CDS:2 [Funneliformis mosseae]
MTHQPQKLLKDIDPAKVQKFKGLFNAEVTELLMEGDEGYEKSLTRWSDNAIKRAGIVVQATCLDDIVKTVKFVGQNNLDFAVCGGGHSTSGNSSSEGGVVLNMRKLNKVRVDVEKKLIYAQGGALFGEVDREAWKYGLATVGGTVEHTGIGGLSIGGGFGYLTGRHGLTVDNVVGATLVTADGQVKELSETVNEDLFWAIRGGGPNFGVVYEFIYKAHEQREVCFGVLIYPGEKLKLIVDAVNESLKENAGPDHSISIIFNRPPPEFRPVIMLLLFSNDPSEQVFRERFSTIYKYGEYVKEIVECIPYPKLNTPANAAAAFGDRKALRDAHISTLTYSTAYKVYDSYVKFTNENPSTGKSVIMFELYSYEKFASIPSKATAFAHRKPFYNVVILQRWINEEDDPIVYNWAKNLQEIINLDGDGDESIYINFENFTEGIDYKGEKLQRVYGENLVRLKELKRKYDPNVLFRKGTIIWP